MASSGGDTNNHDGMVRQSSSTSCASQADNAPYLRVMKTQLNFFMTRLLFMQEQEADSLGARATNARRMNGTNSNSSMNFNNSASRLDHTSIGVDDHGGGSMLGYFDEEPTGDDICVFNDNARILPNSLAKSMPPVPFPKAAPESPRKVEGKEGVRIITPTHQPVTVKAAASLPQLPFGNMAISSSNAGDDDDQPQQPDVVPTDEPPLEPMEYYSEDNYEDSEVEEVPMENDDEHEVEPEEDRKPPARKPSVTNVPLADRVFPKNQRRSKRYSSRERLPHGRSRSLGRRSDSSESESVATDDSAGLQNMDSKSCH